MVNVNNYEKTAMKVSIVSIIWNLILSVGKLYMKITLDILMWNIRFHSQPRMSFVRHP